MNQQPRSRQDAHDWPVSPHEARRFILARVPNSLAVEGLPSDAERHRADEPPELIAPELLEGDRFRAIPVTVPGNARGQSGFGGFLDGRQDVRIVNQVEGVPIVWATVSAAIRIRINRRLVSWPVRPPVVRGRYYLPFRYVDTLHEELRRHPLVVDTGTADAAGRIPSRHPAALMEAAIKRVQIDRERVEKDLAEAWCIAEKSVLFVDGSITSSAAASQSMLAVGVIKSHRRLYADGDSFRVLVGLNAGERSTIFRVTSQTRHSVASWYVRLRGAAGRDALFGLVRVEAAETPDMLARADEISRWILAEASPLALPDGRWDKMAYGIRDTEEFLRAIS